MKRLALFFTLALSFISIFAAPPSIEEGLKVQAGARYFVSVSGNDNNAGTQSAPFKTIYRGVQAAGPGDTVLVADGSYQNIRIDGKNGTSDKWITIRSLNKWGAKIETSGNTYCFTVHNSSYIAVDGFEFTQESALANRATGYGFLQTEGHHITVRNCHAHHCGGNGIAMAYGDYFTAENNLVHHNAYWDPMQTSGISVYEPVASDNAAGFHIVIRGNVIYSNENKVPSPSGEYTDGNGIIMDDFLGSQGNSGHGAYLQYSLVENNTCFDNGRKGIHVFVCKNITVRNNTCYWNNRAVRDNYNLNGELSNVWSGNIKWINNIAWANPAYNSTNNAIANGGDQSENAGVEYINNLTYNGTPGAASVRQWQTTADVSERTGNILGVNPLFISTSPSAQTGLPDFQLQPNSPAIDAGTAASFAAIDMAGIARPIGSGVDIGAFEYSDGTTTPSTPSTGGGTTGGGTTGGGTTGGGTTGGGTTPTTPAVHTELIRLNQIGFYPNGPKMAVVADAGATEFMITSLDQQTEYYTADLADPESWSYSGETVRVADFSTFVTPGEYIVVVPGVGKSSPFEINATVHTQAEKAGLKSFYFQRASIDLVPAFAGDWARSGGHADNAVTVHASAASAVRPAGTEINAAGGWYDSGNFGKYTISSAVSTYPLLNAYEQFPTYYNSLSVNIPESGNAIPDILDEALFNLRWLMTMQDPSEGFVYHKLTGLDFSGMVMPTDDAQGRYVIGKSTAAALDFAAVMAQASRVYSVFDPAFSAASLSAARKAWNWARRNPSMAFANPSDVNTLEYRDQQFADEFLWAASELYITTREDSFWVASNLGTYNFTGVQSWKEVAPMALMSLVLNRARLTAVANPAQIENKFLGIAQDILYHNMVESAYKVPMGAVAAHFSRGSNGVAANLGQMMMHAYALTGDKDYLQAGLGALDYLLGRNATGYSFMTQQGTKTPMSVHNRVSEADGVEAPIPGLLVGGPQMADTDNCQYDFSDPATHYLDAVCSYTTNENAICQNGPMVYLLAAAENLTENFTGVSNPTPLPITVFGDLVLDPDYPNGYVNVDWTTRSELGNDFLVVQRSIDGIAFQDIESLPSLGDSPSAQAYHAYDMDPVVGTMYYRIKQVSVDGTFSYSAVVELEYAPVDEPFIECYPVPVTRGDVLTVNFRLASDVNYCQVIIRSIRGRRVYREVIRVAPGVNTVEIPTNDFLAGNYSVVVSTYFERLAQRITVME